MPKTAENNRFLGKSSKNRQKTTKLNKIEIA
jgi:hypothetical protein